MEYAQFILSAEDMLGEITSLDIRCRLFRQRLVSLSEREQDDPAPYRKLVEHIRSLPGWSQEQLLSLSAAGVYVPWRLKRLRLNLSVASQLIEYAADYVEGGGEARHANETYMAAQKLESVCNESFDIITDIRAQMPTLSTEDLPGP